MPLFASASPFDDDVEKATAANNTSEDWTKIMDICDQIPRSPSGPKDALKAIMKRVNDRIPQVSLQALTLLNACVNNCGKVFHLEVCSRDFVSEVRSSLLKVHPTVALKFKGMIRDWSKTFKDDPQLVLIPTLYEELKREKEEFPDEKTLTNVALSPSVKKTSKKGQNEDDDLALAIKLSLKESEAQVKTSSLYSSVSSSLSSSSSNKTKKVRALYDFVAAEDNELTFKTGDIITVTDSSDANWWKGELQGKSGLFPANFVTSDLTPEPAPVKKKSKKKKKKVSFSGKNSVKEFDGSTAVSQPPVISEEKVDQCLEMLQNANVEEEDEDDEGLLLLEESCKKMGPLVEDVIANIQKNQDELSEINDNFLRAMELYQRFCKEPLPQPYVRNVPSPQLSYGHTYNMQPTSTQQPYRANSYAVYPGVQYPGQEAMNTQYSVQSVPTQPAYGSQVNQAQYLPQHQTTSIPGPPQEYAYSAAGQVPVQYQSEQHYSLPTQYPVTAPYQTQYPNAMSPSYANEPHPQLITAQSHY